MFQNATFFVVFPRVSLGFPTKVLINQYMIQKITILKVALFFLILNAKIIDTL